MVWRRMRVPGSTSLARLHQCIQLVNGWDDFYLHQFHIYGKDYGINYVGGLSYSDNAHKVFVDDFDFDIGDKFTYEYNFFEHIMHDIRIEDIKDLITTDDVVSCINGVGMPGATKYDVMDIELEMLKKFVATKGKLTYSDITELREKINRVKFNKKQTNANLTTIKTE